MRRKTRYLVRKTCFTAKKRVQVLVLCPKVCENRSKRKGFKNEPHSKWLLIFRHRNKQHILDSQAFPVLNRTCVLASNPDHSISLLSF
mmetsp:Transcript_2899/g.3988  ORF Transcript_2899/g.3988 Transcript_2899/m.3988 type:complete len:88 (-) Transcript_2899:93-356(-)